MIVYCTSKKGLLLIVAIYPLSILAWASDDELRAIKKQLRRINDISSPLLESKVTAVTSEEVQVIQQ